MTVGEKIRHFRTEKKLSQKQLAQMTGMSEPGLRNYELGNRTPSWESLEKIAGALGVSIYAISEPCLDNCSGVMQTLFELENNYGMTIKDVCGEMCLTFEHAPEKLAEGMRLWRDELDKLENGEITRDEYDMWRYGFMREHEAAPEDEAGGNA